MEKRQFKNTSEMISLLGFGSLRPPRKNGKPDIDLFANMVDYALNNGVNYFDTAYGYLGGKAEILFGDILKNYPREQYNIATKMPMYNIKTTTELDEIFQLQLKRLNTDYIDYYLFHAVKSSNWGNFKKSELYDFLLKKKKDGIIRYIGFSFHDKPGLLSEVADEYDWDFAQIQLNYMDWTFQNAEEQYNILKRRSLPIIVMEPLRGGGLASLCDKSIEIFKKADAEASAASWGLRYAASFPEIVCVLSGMSNMEQVTDNIKTFQNFIPISAAEQEVIQNALNSYLEVTAIPCTGCGYCLDCPKNIDIPSFFSIYNILMQKGEVADKTAISNFLLNYNIIPSTRSINLCSKCGLCKKQCPQYIDIPVELQKISNTYRKLKEGKKPNMNNNLSANLLNFCCDNVPEKMIIRENFWKMRNLSWNNYVEFIRIKQHCIKPPAPNENRWVYIPLAQPLKINEKYILELKIKFTHKTTTALFVCNDKSKPQLLPKIEINPDEWQTFNLEFVPDSNDYIYLCFTATDFPIAGSALQIENIIVSQKQNG